MNIDDIVYLKDILGEEKAKKYLKADEEKLRLLVAVLRNTNINRILNPDMLNEFCNKIVYEKYGKVYARVLCNIGKINVNSRYLYVYKQFLNDYISCGCNDDVAYKKLFEHIDEIAVYYSIGLNYNDKIKELVDKEVSINNVSKVTVDKFITDGGSLNELIAVINKCEIKEFNGSTQIPVSLLEIVKQEKYEVNIYEIGFLVSLISSLNLDEKIQTELLEVYYDGLEQSKRNGFSTATLVVENKPKLYEFLREKNILNILENVKDNKDVKKNVKIKK